MMSFKEEVSVGLRHNETNEIVAIYPHKVNPEDKDIESRVKFWYYQQDCSAERELKNLHVDILTAAETRSELLDSY